MSTVLAEGRGFDVAAVEEIRSHFPALERTHAGRPVAYFDGPGGTQVPRRVADAMVDYLYHHNANSDWAYPTSVETDEVLENARRALGTFLGGHAGEVAFGANMTTLTYHLGRALGRRMHEGDTIVVTELDHHANVDPWRTLARERGVRIRTVSMLPETGTLDWEDLERAIEEEPRLLAIGAASNALGTINDVPRAARLARAAGAQVFVDAVHYAPHAPVDVAAWSADFVACSAYKFYGPHVGVLWGREELLTELDVPRLVPAPDRAPERMETGTQNHEGIAGAAAAVDFLAALATPAGETDDDADGRGPDSARRAHLEATMGALHRRGEELFSTLWEGLSATPGVRVFGPPPGQPRTSTVCFEVARQDPADVTRRLAAEAGVFVTHGDFYATALVQRLGRADTGLLRAGLACYSTAEEVERLVEGVAAIAG